MGVGFDQSKDGLSTVTIDGSGLKLLASSVNLNRFGQYPWSNVSRDGNFFSVTGAGIYIGRLSGAYGLVKVAIPGDTDAELFLAGWTTF